MGAVKTEGMLRRIGFAAYKEFRYRVDLVCEIECSKIDRKAVAAEAMVPQDIIDRNTKPHVADRVTIKRK